MFYKSLSERIREAQEQVAERPVDGETGPCPPYKEPPINTGRVLARPAVESKPEEQPKEYREPPIKSQLYMPSGRVKPVSAALLRYFSTPKRPGK